MTNTLTYRVIGSASVCFEKWSPPWIDAGRQFGIERQLSEQAIAAAKVKYRLWEFYMLIESGLDSTQQGSESRNRFQIEPQQIRFSLVV